MTRDPIVDDVRRARQAVFDECGGDLEKLMDRLKAEEEKDRSRLVTLQSVREKQRQVDSGTHS